MMRSCRWPLSLSREQGCPLISVVINKACTTSDVPRRVHEHGVQRPSRNHEDKNELWTLSSYLPSPSLLAGGRRTFTVVIHNLGFSLKRKGLTLLLLRKQAGLAFFFQYDWEGGVSIGDMTMQYSNGWSTWWNVEILGFSNFSSWGVLTCTSCTSQKVD